MPGENREGTLHLQTGFFPLAFILFFIRPRLEVDGEDVPLAGWGESSHRLPAGPRQITVYFPYMMPKRAGEATTKVTIPAGGEVSLKYRAPILVFQPGKFT